MFVCDFIYICIEIFHLLHRERKEYDSKNRKVENIYFLINLFYYEEEVY